MFKSFYREGWTDCAYIPTVMGEYQERKDNSTKELHENPRTGNAISEMKSVLNSD